MNEKQKVLQLIEAMQKKEKDGSLLWCVAEDLKTMGPGQQPVRPGPMVPKILRKCFGLPDENAQAMQPTPEPVQAPAEPAKPKRKRLDILDFM